MKVATDSARLFLIAQILIQKTDLEDLWIQKSSKSRFISVLPVKIFFQKKKVATFSKSPYESLKS